jgi:6-phosphofructokinase 2
MEVTGWTRENLNVLEEVSGRQFRFCMPGATLGDHEWPIFLDWVRQLRPSPDFMVASGSLPPGVPVDFYARLAALGRQMGSRVVLDTSGAPLASAVQEGVYLLKPSLHEFQALMGGDEGDESHLTSLAATVVKRGWCEILVLSLGAGGALCVTASERERLTAPAVRVKSSVGAGDSMVAGMVLCLAEGRALGEAVRFGVAAGAAAVMNPGTALCRREDVERLYPLVMTSPG